MEHTSINGYVLKYKLGDGGMAEVWYAENYLQKPAAIKILLKKFCEEADLVARFQNEARLMVQLNHPNIRNIQDFGMIEGRPCMIMEYLEGKDLSARMKSGEPFSSDQLVEWWNSLVDALQYTHRKHIVHRDIKPANIFVTDNGQVKLLDFGVAKIKDNITVTQTGSRMGTLMYMSPEQVYDVKNLTYKTDNYSLAVTFYHLVTGKAPYDSTKISDFEIQESIVRKNIDTAILPQPWQDLLPGYFNKNAEQRRELHEIRPDALENNDATMYIKPAEPVMQGASHRNGKPQPVYKQPSAQKRSPFYVLFPVAVVLGLVAFALNKDKIAGYFKKDTQSAPGEVIRRPKQRQKKTGGATSDTPAKLSDTIISNGDDGNTDQVIVSADPAQIEAGIKALVEDYYRSRSQCNNLSTYFTGVVKQYYTQSNVSLDAIKKDCESYHSKWQYTEADIHNDSFVFTHSQGGKVYVDFNMLYKRKAGELDDWTPYNIDVSMVIDENHKIERIVERRIEKL